MNSTPINTTKIYLNKYYLAVIVLFITPLSGLSIDIYIPSLPAVSHYFGVEKAMSQLSISAYMLGLGVMQLFAGAITDSFGRKRPFIIAMVIFIIATFLVSFSSNIYQLLFLRLIQGIAIATVVSPMRAVISDLFSGREFYKMANYMTMAWSIGPIIAPAIGGYLQHLFGWQSCFIFLGLYSGLGLLLIWLFLPETSPQQHPFHLYNISKRYREIIVHPLFLRGVLLNSMLYSMIILFAAVGPFLIQDVLHFSAIQFGYFSLLTGLAWFFGTFTNRFLIDVEFHIKAKYCLWSMLLISIITFMATFYFPLSIYIILVPVFSLFWIGGIIFPDNFARVVSLFPHSAGSVSSLFAAFVFLITAFNSGLGTYLKSTTATPLLGAYVLLMTICLMLASNAIQYKKSSCKTEF